MATEVVPYVVDVPERFAEQKEMAISIAASDLLPAHLRNKPANVLIIIAGARALGVSWFQALQSFFVVEGKLSMSAEMMRSLVIRNGHKFRILEMTDTEAKVELIRKDDPEVSFTTSFTIEDAKKAELLGKSNWKKYPSAMLLARATSKAVRSYIPDALAGNVYTPEELGARVNEEGIPEVDANGTVILDGEDATTDNGMRLQAQVDNYGGRLVYHTFDDALIAYKALLVGQWTHLVPNLEGFENEKTLYQLWMDRLVLDIDTVVPAVESGSATPDAAKDLLRQLWIAARDTGVLAQQYELDGSMLTVNEWINKSVTKVDELVAKKAAAAAADEPAEVIEPDEILPAAEVSP